MSGLGDRTPDFLVLLDTDPSAAMEGFYKFAKLLFQVAPPGIFRRLSIDRRDDVFHEVVRHCIDRNFRVLRQYQPHKRATFAGWLSIVATRKIADMLRRDASIARVEVSNPGADDDSGQRPRAVAPDGTPYQIVETAELREIIYGIIRILGRRCRLLIRLCVRGHKNREITMLLGHAQEDNKRIGTQISDCRKKIERMLVAKGYKLSDFLNPGA